MKNYLSEKEYFERNWQERGSRNEKLTSRYHMMTVNELARNAPTVLPVLEEVRGVSVFFLLYEIALCVIFSNRRNRTATVTRNTHFSRRCQRTVSTWHLSSVNPLCTNAADCSDGSTTRLRAMAPPEAVLRMSGQDRKNPATLRRSGTRRGQMAVRRVPDWNAGTKVASHVDGPANACPVVCRVFSALLFPPKHSEFLRRSGWKSSCRWAAPWNSPAPRRPRTNCRGHFKRHLMMLWKDVSCVQAKSSQVFVEFQRSVFVDSPKLCSRKHEPL